MTNTFNNSGDSTWRFLMIKRFVLSYKNRFKLFGFVLLFCLLISYSSPVYALKYLGKQENGTYVYKCQGFCGEVKVVKLSKNAYRVLSIPFSGEVRANSPKSAASFACQEGGTVIETMTKPGQSRKIPKC